MTRENKQGMKRAGHKQWVEDFTFDKKHRCVYKAPKYTVFSSVQQRNSLPFAFVYFLKHDYFWNKKAKQVTG